MAIDPITVSVVQHRLGAIVEEMGEVMLRTSYSQILNSSRDFSTALTDPEGRLIAQAEHVPIHVGALPWAVKSVHDFFRARIHRGDVFLLNDPYRGGNHLPDLTAFLPVFDGDQLAFWSINRSHQSDIGGTTHGGYNPAALPGSEAYGEEHAWHIEAGVKSSLFGGKAAASAAVFRVDWDDLQLNVPNPFVPGQFYIANVGGATSSGVEFEVTARPHQVVDVFASFGYTNASFADGTLAMGADVSGHNLPFTPDYTALLGAQLNQSITSSGTSLGAYGGPSFVQIGAPRTISATLVVGF